MLEQVVSTTYAISIIGILLFVAVFFEWKKSMSVGRKLIRSVGLIFLAVGLLALFSKPTIQTEKKGTTVALLTENYSLHTLDSLKRAVPKLRIFVTGSLNQNHKKANSIDELLSLEPIIDELHILGSGVDQWPDSLYFPVRFWPTTPTGVVAIDAPQQLNLGDSAWISLFTKFSDTVLIVLRKPGGAVDSAIVSSEIGRASFLIHPKNEGQHLYRISIQTPEGIVEEKLGIGVNRREGMRILILNGYPSFETKYLKSWLGSKGHGIAVRSKISEGKYRYEYIHMAASPFESFDENLYDVTILDESTFNSLRKGKLDELVQAVESGMGLFVQGGRLPDHLLIQEWFDFQESENKTALFHGQELNKFPFQFKKGRLNSAIIESNNEIVAQKRILGDGAVSMSFISQTFPLLLQGKTQLYSKHWGAILSSIAIDKEEELTMEISSTIPRVDYPLDITITTGGEEPSVRINDFVMPLIKDLNFADQWKGTHWPLSSGWAALYVSEGSNTNDWFYVYPKDAWNSVREYDKMINSMSKIQDLAIEESAPVAKSVINSWYWYALILLSLTVLWVEPKL